MIRAGRQTVNDRLIDLTRIESDVVVGDELREFVGPRLELPDHRPDRPEIGEPERPETALTGFIIVRLEADVASLVSPDEYRTLFEFAEAAGLEGLASVLAEFDLRTSWPAVRSVSAERILELEARARQSELPPLRSLTSYWKVDARAHGARLRSIIKALQATPSVGSAYPDLVASDPAVAAANDIYNAQQSYLDAAPDGIDARWAWTQPNGEGAGIGVIDLEQGWFLTHEDFTNKAPAIVVGDNRDGVGTYVGNHGSAVLGEVIADDNALGVVGAAPAAGPVRCASHYDSATNTSGNVSDAVIGAIDVLNAGDALIIEVQTNFLPTETVDENFDAIRLASALGIMVFAAAGNGSSNLDNFMHPTTGALVLNRTDAGFRESGAIMVGASIDTVPHDRKAASNFGNRVDCYAWGQNVVTCGYGTLDSGGGDNDKTYANNFQNTSAATPIVTGAGVIVQGMHEANTGVRLSPMQVRDLLSDPATGTAQGANVAGTIGVMPDLRAIIENTLGLTADVYLRDNIADTGAVPTSGGVSASPDIFVRPFEIADPTAAFGEGSGHENSTNLGFAVEGGQNNFVYTRMKNRGATAANNVAVDVYWSEVSTLVTPDMWNMIGTTNQVASVPVGDTLVVTDPLTWAEADIPAEGHYCFIGVAGSADDPAPPLPSATDWNGFASFIKNQNNVAWRNFNVVDAIEDPDQDPYLAGFLIANFPDQRRLFDFVIEQRLAERVNVKLELPLQIMKPFVSGLDVDFKVDRRRRTAIIDLPRSQRLSIRNVALPSEARLQCRFIVEGAAKSGRPGNNISIAQIWDRLEVGRVTWQFSRKRDPERACGLENRQKG